MNALRFSGKAKDAPLAVVNGEENEGEALWNAVRARTDRDFSLLLLSGFDWDDALSPWPAKNVFPGQRPFGGGADAHLKRLEEMLSREAPGAGPRYLMLAGYSLAGLFAVYAALKTDLFSRVACASGSLWYPGFMDFMKDNPPLRPLDRAYFSLGDREARTKNPLLRTVEENSRAAAEWFSAQGTKTVFELNPGNHFQQPTERLAKGVAWLLEEDGA